MSSAGTFQMTRLSVAGNKIVIGIIAALIISVASITGQSFKQIGKGFYMPVQEKARVRAPELTGGRGWLNTDQPLSIAALKGKVILLDFWLHQLHSYHSGFEEAGSEVCETAGGHRSAFRKV